MINEQILKKNIQNIQENVASHSHAGQAPTVVAVTKGRTAEDMRSLVDQGLQHFGENRPQELLRKMDELSDIKDQIDWHYIGRLQRRPVKDFINKIDYLHSLDRDRLAQEVNKRADRLIKCFVQVNVSQEEQKAGVSPEELDRFIQNLAQYENIQVVGLMTMAPYGAEESELRTLFQTMKQLQVEIAGKQYSHAPCQELSMGMSQDYVIALEEGATFVRIGSAFFQE